MNNIKDNVSELKTKDLNINYIDFDKFKNLTKLNKIKNKNPSSYYMINGSRKINLPEVSDMTEASEKNIFSEVSPLSVNTLSGGKNKSKKSKSHKKDDYSSTSFTFSDITVTATDSKTKVNPEITSVSERGKSSSSSKGSSSSSSAKNSSTTSKGSSSSSSSSKDLSRQRYNDMGYTNHLDKNTQSKLNSLPENYFDLAPDHMLNGLQGMQGADMGIPQGDMGMPQMNGDMGMPQMPMNMAQMPPMPAQMPPMPADMQQAAMNSGMMPQMAMPQMAMPGQMHPQLNVPMMNNPMASFMGMGQAQGMQMGGGEQKELKKYKLTLDNFFF